MLKQSIPFQKATNPIARKCLSAAICALVLTVSNPVFAQSTNGAVRGTVQGASNGTVVEVIDTSRGTARSEATGNDGEFRIDGLAPGAYQVRVLQNGAVVDTLEIEVSLGSATTVNLATTTTVINEIVTTGSRRAAVDTSIAESGLIISSDLLLEMPLKET